MIRIIKGNSFTRAELFGTAEQVPGIRDTVANILEDIRARGDEAVKEYTLRFDRAQLDALEVPASEIDAAVDKTDPELLRVMRLAADNIREYHTKQLRHDYVITRENGAVLGQRVIPLERVGVYVPGGTASLASSVLMDCIPAKIAGVKEIIMCTPPAADGSILPSMLAAAKIAGVDRVFRVGGAQAIAAMAFGTASIPRVDKIAGPGNAYVNEAKRQVFGEVDIDMIAGPSEILVVADEGCEARIVAADMLSQAEHGELSSAVLVTTSEKLAEEVSAELERQLELLPRGEIARVSIDEHGLIVITDTIENAVEIANVIAPEHLELCVDDPFSLLGKVRNAGSVFLGRNCPEPLGDYLAGTNHTLPTGGTARFSSPLSVDDFVKKMSFTYYTAKALESVSQDIRIFAEAEGLHAHGRSATIRFDPKEK